MDFLKSIGRVLYGKKPAPKLIGYRYRLCVYMTNGGELSLHKDVKTKKVPKEIRKFYGWYNGRPQSKSFTFRCKNKDITVLRKNIYRFVLEWNGNYDV